jgi:transcriptional regulator with XRE-family HTH domain
MRLNIKELRTQFGLSQQELSEQTGIPRDRIAGWERFGSQPKVKDHDILIKFFEDLKTNPKSNDVPVWIRKNRTKHNFTQEDLAKRLQITRDTIARWERGFTTPNKMEIKSLEALFNDQEPQNQNTNMDLNIKEYRIEFGLSQRQVSEATGIKSHLINAWEQGRGNPDYKEYQILKTYFEGLPKNEKSDAEWLRYNRKKFGFTQEELADNLQVTRATIVNWEKGKTTPNKMEKLSLQKLFQENKDELKKDLSKGIDTNEQTDTFDHVNRLLAKENETLKDENKRLVENINIHKDLVELLKQRVRALEKICEEHRIAYQ